MEQILFTAKKLSHIHYIQFIICGSGPYVNHLVAQKEKLALNNVVFLPIQPLQTFNKILNLADFHLVIQKSNASDLMLPSKLTNIWAVGGVPIIAASEGSELYNTTCKFNTGIIIDPNDSNALHNGIIKAISEDTSTISENARTYAERHLSFESIMTDFEINVL